MLQPQSLAIIPSASLSVATSWLFTSSGVAVDTQTITIGGVVFTAAADNSAATAGEFTIQASEDNCMATLVTAINGSGTP